MLHYQGGMNFQLVEKFQYVGVLSFLKILRDFMAILLGIWRPFCCEPLVDFWG